MAEAEQNTAREHLQRARRYMKDGSSRALAQAARELVQGIQERVREYEEARRELKRKKRQGWSVAQLGIKVEKAYKSADSIIEISVFDRTPDRKVVTLYHTPVCPEMKVRAERLASHLENSAGNIPPFGAVDQWREWVRKSAEDLRTVTHGTLLVPPLLNKKATKMVFRVEEVDANRTAAVREALALVGIRYKLHAQRLDHLP